MTPCKIYVVGGWCGNRMVMVAEHLEEVLAKAGYPCRINTHSVWENTQPPVADLILQLLPAFSEAEAKCPVVGIRPLLVDLDDPKTLERVFNALQALPPAVPAAQGQARAAS